MRSGDGCARKIVLAMGFKTKLTFGAVGIALLLIAGVAYWTISKGSHRIERTDSTAVPPAPQPSVPPATPAQNPPAAEQPSQVASPETTTPSGAAAPSLGQTAKPPPSPLTPSATATPSETTAQQANLPAEGSMSEPQRRQVQEALHRLDYYEGTVDGIFGPQTRAGIRRFQDSIGAKGTGYLTAEEANRLVSAY